MALVEDAHGKTIERKRNTVSVPSNSNKSIGSSASTTNNTKKTEEYDLSAQKKQEAERAAIEAEKKKQKELEEQRKKEEEKQMKKYKDAAAALEKELDNLNLKYDFFKNEIINTSDDELGILAEGKIRGTDEYGRPTVYLMDPAEYAKKQTLYYFESGEYVSETEIKDKIARYTAAYEEAFYKVTKTPYDVFFGEVQKVVQKKIELNANMPGDAFTKKSELIESYLRMAEEEHQKNLKELKELERKYGLFINGLKGNGEEFTVDKDYYKLVYTYNFSPPDYVKSDGDIEWITAWAVNNGYDSGQVTPTNGDYENILAGFYKYVDEVYTPLYNQLFYAEMGMTKDGFDRKINDLYVNVMQYGNMAYDLKQQKKELPYLKIAETDEYKSYNFSENPDEQFRYLYLDEYNYLEDEEKKMYSYLYDTKGKDNANAYLEAIKDKINQRKGLEEYNNFMDSISKDGYIVDDFWSVLDVFGGGFGSGGEGFFEGLENLWAADGVKSDNQYFQMYMLMTLGDLQTYFLNAKAEEIKNAIGEEEASIFLEKICDKNGNIDMKVAEEYFSPSDFERLNDYKTSILDNSFEFGITAGNMAPAQVAAIATNLIAPGSGEWVATSLIGLSSMGNTANEKMIQGYGKLESYAIGLVNGTSEALLEKAFGNIGFLNPSAALSVKGIASEITGELLQTAFQSTFNMSVLGEEVDANELGDEALKTIIYTGLLSLISTGGQSVLNISINGKRANFTNVSAYADFVGMMNSGTISLTKNSDGKVVCVVNDDVQLSSSKLAEIQQMFPGVDVVQNVGGGLFSLYNPNSSDSTSKVDAIVNGDQSITKPDAIINTSDKNTNKDSTSSTDFVSGLTDKTDGIVKFREDVGKAATSIKNSVDSVVSEMSTVNKTDVNTNIESDVTGVDSKTEINSIEDSQVIENDSKEYERVTTDKLDENWRENQQQTIKMSPEEFLELLENGQFPEGLPRVLEMTVIRKDSNGKTVKVKQKISTYSCFKLLFSNALATNFVETLNKNEKWDLVVFKDFENFEILNALSKCANYLKNNNYEISFGNSNNPLVDRFLKSHSSPYEISTNNKLYSPSDISGGSAVDQNIVRSIAMSNHPVDQELKGKLIEMVQDSYPGISIKDARKFLESIDAPKNGVCNYADVCNAIFELFVGKEVEFEEKFGFPMYYNGKLNDAQLLLDIFLFVSGDLRIEQKDGVWKFNESDDYNYLSGFLEESEMYKVALIENYLSMLGLYGEGANVSEKQMYASVRDNKNYYDSNNANESILKEVNESLKKGEHVSIASLEGLLMKHVGTGEYRVLGGGHIMSVYGIDADGNLLVDSWGQKFAIDLRHAIASGVDFKIASLDIKLSESNVLDYDKTVNTNIISSSDIPSLSASKLVEIINLFGDDIESITKIINLMTTDQFLDYFSMFKGDIASTEKIVKLMSDEQLINVLNEWDSVSFIGSSGKEYNVKYSFINDKTIYKNIVTSLSLDQLIYVYSKNKLQFSNNGHQMSFDLSNNKVISVASLIEIIRRGDLNNLVEAVNNGKDYYSDYTNVELLIGFQKMLEEFEKMGYNNNLGGNVKVISELTNKIGSLLNSKEYDSNATVTMENDFTNSVNESSNFNVPEAIETELLADSSSFDNVTNVTNYEVGRIKTEILESMPSGLDGFSQIRYLYLELNKRINYDADYITGDTSVKSTIYNKEVNFDSLASNKVICKGWSELFRELLISAGFDPNIISVVGPGIHKWVEIDCGDAIIRADATQNYNNTNDLSTSKSGSATVGFLYLHRSYSGIDSKSFDQSVYDNNSDWLRSLDNSIGYTNNGSYFNEVLNMAKDSFYSPSIVEKIFGVKPEKVYESKVNEFINMCVPVGMDSIDICNYFRQVNKIIFGDDSNINVSPYTRFFTDGTKSCAIIIKVPGFDANSPKICKIIDSVSGESIMSFDNFTQVSNYLSSQGYVAGLK